MDPHRKKGSSRRRGFADETSERKGSKPSWSIVDIKQDVELAMRCWCTAHDP